ncbi:MAG: cupredoxin domain-containing protein [Candidatus Anstonellaceae archaeon]
MVNQKHLFIFVGMLVLAFVGFMIFDSQGRSRGYGGDCGPNGCSGAGMPVGDASLKEFTITASRFKFEPSTITVNKGDRVRLTLRNSDVSHGIAISEFNVDLRAGAGETKSIEFLADKEGTFNFFCSIYCGDGHPEMSGKLVVKGSGSGGQLDSPSGEVQVVSLRGTPYGYDKSRISVKAGQPVKFDFSADPASGCGRQVIIDNVGVNLVSRNGETVSATFTPPAPGIYKYHCSMNMFRGELVAV